MRISRFAVWFLLPALVIGASETAKAAPVLTSVAPATGETSGGEAVTLTGTGFVSGCTAAFGGVAAASVTVGSSTAMTATTPAHAAGAVAVSVTCPDGSATLNDAFTFLAPATGAGSGDLWYQGNSCDDQPRILLDTAGPVTITARVPPSSRAGAVDLELVDANGAIVFTASLDFPGGRTSRTVMSPSVPAGTYEVRLTTLPLDGLRLTTSASYFVWPKCTRFRKPPPGDGDGVSGYYNFYVPPQTTTFTFRMKVFRAGSHPLWRYAAILAPDGTVRGAIDDVELNQYDIVIHVVPAIAGAFWSVFLENFEAAIEVSIEGVPSFLAESPAAWFEPAGAKAKTYVDLDLSPPSPRTGETVTFTATMAPHGATGTVAFLVDGTPLATVPVSGGIASASTTFPSAALHEVRADYSGDNLRGPSTATATAIMLPPTLTGISSRDGNDAGDNPVTLTGTNFAADCTVSFGKVAAPSIEVNSTTTITLKTPRHEEATVGVSVNCPSGSATLANAFTFLAPASGAGSGTLWDQGWPVDSHKILFETAGPGRITAELTVGWRTGALDLSLVDVKGLTVFSRRIDYPHGTSIRTVPTPALPAGIYSVRRSVSGHDLLRTRSSAAGFIQTPQAGFEGPGGGSYYFYVPRNTPSFTFRIRAAGGGYQDNAGATIYDPDGVRRGAAGSNALAGQPGEVTVDVDPASSGAFWKVALSVCECRIVVTLEGVPSIFAESPSAWFEPATDGEHAKTYLNLTASLLASARSGAARGPNVLATATVVPAPAAGSITFVVDGQPAGTFSLTDGQAALSLTLRTAGPHTIEAAYAGNGVWTASGASETIIIPAQQEESIPLISPEAMLLLAIGLAAAAMWGMKT